jgi:pyridoxal phosphate enzyme (YggS family)
VHLGENYVQELVDKRGLLGGGQHEPPLWHAIGHLQRNKVKYLVGQCALIHSLDSPRLADEMNQRAEQVGGAQPVLIEVNIAGEDTKFGVQPRDVEALAQYLAQLGSVRLQGLMAMTPYQAGADEARRYFGEVRELASRLGRNLPEGAMATLSMGMTQDFEIAVEQGATLVRVGTAIFGERRRDG